MNEVMTLVIGLPLLGALIAAAWPTFSRIVGIVSVTLSTLAGLWLLSLFASQGEHSQVLGGWQTGLGIRLHVDALSALMLAMTALVALAVSVYAMHYFPKQRKAMAFWPLWLLLLSALHALYLSADLFNLYVTLELLGISAVALTALGQSGPALSAAFRYLVMGLLGSLAYLAGVALLYLDHGTLDMAQVSAQLSGQPASLLALVLMTAGLLLKTALFPLHFWLPQAHGNAPAPVSAALSALVVKAGFYLVFRLWSSVFPDAMAPESGWVLLLLGSGAVLWGSWQALRAERLKVLAAYSTVAQLGYLFIGLGLWVQVQDPATKSLLLGAVVMLALTHGFAKAALFMAIGSVQQHAGHDRIAELGGTAQRLPATTFTIALAGVALIGLPPSGAFLGKWQLLQAAMEAGLWLLIAVVAIGSLLAAAYTFKVLDHAFGREAYALRPINSAPVEWPGLLLALAATVVLGLFGAPVWAFMESQA